MFNKFNSIRFTYIRSHLYSLLLIILTLLSVFLLIQVLFSLDWLSIQSILIIMIMYIIIGLPLSFYIGVKSVKTHVSNVLSKLEIKDHTRATVYVHKNNLLK